MEQYLTISTLNDFIFCPRSIYFHSFYKDKAENIFQGKPQVEGLLAHESIDNKNYSTQKNILQGVYVYSEKYNILGKIDTFNIETGELVERKRSIVKIYDGYIFQIYAQYFSLIEMEFNVKTLSLYSLIDNKKFNIRLPSEDFEMEQKFEKLIDKISKYNLSDPIEVNENKCKNCIYSPMCDISKC